MKKHTKIEFKFSGINYLSDDDFDVLEDKLYEFVDYIAPRLYLRRGQFLQCDVEVKNKNGENMFFVVFSVFLTTKDKIFKALVSTSYSFDGLLAVVFSKDKIYKHIGVYLYEFFYESSFDLMTQCVIEKLRDKKHPERYPR